MTRLGIGIRYAATDIWGDLAGWFFVGIMAAGIITVLLPDEIITNYLGGGLSSWIMTFHSACLRILRMHANKREELENAQAGLIVAIPGLKQVRTGDTLCDEKDNISISSNSARSPLIRNGLFGKIAQFMPALRSAQEPRATSCSYTAEGTISLTSTSFFKSK